GGHDRAGNSDESLGCRVGAQRAAYRPRPTPRQMPSQPRADGEPAHEHRKHDRDGCCGYAECRHGEPCPHRFVNEATEARDQEHCVEETVRWSWSHGAATVSPRWVQQAATTSRYDQIIPFCRLAAVASPLALRGA